jgi:sugar-specific transcriptional regulator TrmB
MPDSHIDALVALGLTPIEAATYACLLQYPESTGYGVARRIGKPTANTYKALAALEGWGAVTLSGDVRRLYSAVGADEWLDTLERRFRQHRERAARGLATLAAPGRSGGIGRLQTFDQLIARIRRMLGRCRTTAVLDLAPPALEVLSDDLAAAAESGADIRVKVYAPVSIAGVDCVRGEGGAPGPANAVIDGREAVVAALDGDPPRVAHALWSVQRNVVVAAHRAVVAELLFTALGAGLERGLSIDDVEETFAAYARLRGAGSDERGAG